MSNVASDGFPDISLAISLRAPQKIAHFADQSEGRPVATTLFAAAHQWTLVLFEVPAW